MNNLEYIAANLSDEDILCQIAEEAAELAQAALKLRRAITGTNPTPVSYDEALNNLVEEYSDTTGAFGVYAVKQFGEDLSIVVEKVESTTATKYKRWADRIKESKKHGN